MARLLYASHETSRGDSQRTGNLDDIHQTDVSLPALNPADVRPVKIGSFGKPLLRQTQRKPLLSDRLAELCPGISFHVPDLQTAQTLMLETISITIRVAAQCYELTVNPEREAL